MISLGLAFQITKCTDIIKKCTTFYFINYHIWLIISVGFKFSWILCVLIHKELLNF